METGTVQLSKVLQKKYTVDEVASMMGCSPHTVYRAIKSGDLPAYKIHNKGYQILLGDIEQWFDSKKVEPVE